MNTSNEFGMTHVYLPSSTPGAPTFLLLHGTGGDETDLIPLARDLHPDATILSPRGNVSENGMLRFFRRLAPGVFDIEDLFARTHELHAFIRSATEGYKIEHEKMIAIGYSNGANIAASLLLMHDTVRTAALLHPMLPFEPKELPDLSANRVFISAGEKDPMVPREGTESLVKLLQKCGASVDVYWNEGGHGITEEEVGAVKEWLRNV